MPLPRAVWIQTVGTRLAQSGSARPAPMVASYGRSHSTSALVTAAGITLHVRLREGRNTHHVLEAAFKGVARALRDAVRVEGGGIPSTKGTL